MWLNSSLFAGFIIWFYLTRSGLEVFVRALAIFNSEPWFATVHFGMTIILLAGWGLRKALEEGG